MSTEITEPGVYELTNGDYHFPRDCLSHSGAKLLRKPSCPAIFQWQREHGRPPKKHLDYGSAAHKIVLGDVDQILVVVEEDDWRKKASQDKQREAWANHQIPVLTKDLAAIEMMAQAIREHPIAGPLLDPTRGRVEPSLFWRDPDFDLLRSARLDFLPHPGPGRLIIPDYKTAKSAEPEEFARSAASFGYHTQADWYQEAARALGLGKDPVVVFVVQEREPPYVVTVCELKAESMRLAARQNREAIETYIACRESGRWPGYSDEVEQIELPYWYLRANEEDEFTMEDVVTQ